MVVWEEPKKNYKKLVLFSSWCIMYRFMIIIFILFSFIKGWHMYYVSQRSIREIRKIYVIGQNICKQNFLLFAKYNFSKKKILYLYLTADSIIIIMSEYFFGLRVFMNTKNIKFLGSFCATFLRFCLT